MGGLLSWFQNLFWSQEMEIAIVGLQNAGKTSFVHVIQNGSFEENMIPTIGFNMRKVQKGNVTIKVWDMGGQKRFRGMWERYCRDVNVIVFIVDSADDKAFAMSKEELEHLLSYSVLDGIPLLVLFNKSDKKEASDEKTIHSALGLDTITNREVESFGISCKNLTNIDKALDWLTKRSKSKASNAPRGGSS